MLLPALSKARQKAHGATCQASLKQLGTSLALYRDEWDELYPNAIYSSGASPYPLIYEFLDDYVGDPRIWLCPVRNGICRGGLERSYTYNGRTYKMYPNIGWNSLLANLSDASVTHPAETIGIADCSHPIWASMVDRIAYASSGDLVRYGTGGGSWPNGNRAYMVTTYSRHGNGENMNWLDGHVTFMPSRELYFTGSAKTLTPTR